MTSPISNNNPAHVGNNKASQTVEKQNSQGDDQGHGKGVAVGRQEDAVSLSRAAQVLGEPPSERGQGQIQSPEQAAQVAKGLKALFEGNSGEALAVQARNLNKDLLELLKAG